MVLEEKQKLSQVSYIKPCKPTDKACMLASAQNAIQYVSSGIPEFGVIPSDPLSINDVRNDDANLKLGFRNMKIVGASKCKVENISRDLAKSTVTVTMECPLKANGQYDLKGKMLFFEAFGDGDFEIKTNRVKITVVQKIKSVQGADGKKHWKITGFDYSYDLVEKVDIQFDNLFGGDETRAKPILEIMNHSWKDMVTEIGGPIIKQLLSEIIAIVNKFYHAVPSENFEIVE
ncbi:circadian clock-controlled protein daywake-like [Zerene cesonia]|uniref:circadian clock-controlled protein daywake-like n=1 Tax=Zerene cesonia TaxID=33412 RepID=UPI0018E50822|nr:circadian clock-controlled protein daywake-like [Zerene cesonia]